MVCVSLGIGEQLQPAPWKVTKICQSTINKLQCAIQKPSFSLETFSGFPSHKTMESHCSRRYIWFQCFNLLHVSSPAAHWQNKHWAFQLHFPCCSLNPQWQHSPVGWEGECVLVKAGQALGCFQFQLPQPSFYF